MQQEAIKTFGQAIERDGAAIVLTFPEGPFVAANVLDVLPAHVIVFELGVRATNALWTQ